MDDAYFQQEYSKSNTLFSTVENKVLLLERRDNRQSW